MKKDSVRAFIILLAFAAACAADAPDARRADAPGGARASARDEGGSNLVGDWEGESVCGEGFPSCRGEHVVYHITKPPDERGNVTIAADKVVNGRAEPMGVIQFEYDAARRTLTGELKGGRFRGVWEFKVEGGAMEGTLTILPDKSVARRVKVRKVS